MTERILATGQVRAQIVAELQAYREQYADYIKERHPQVSFLPLSELVTNPNYALLVHQPLLKKALRLVVKGLHDYGPYDLLDPTRVWVGVAMPPNEDYFGGFHHHDQGYRYLQQIAIVSLSGALACHPVDRTLLTLELIRGYTHDTLHHNCYRLFCPLPQPKATSFYRLQYGINFRKWNDITYSAKDSVRSATTRNLGTIMEAATDRFAHELVLSLAQTIGYALTPTHSHNGCCSPTPDPTYYYVYRDCTGQLTQTDIGKLRDIERGEQSINTSTNFKIYLKAMRLFVQYVNLRYQQFLAEFDPKRYFQLHHLIIQTMLSGKLKELCQCLDSIQATQRSFVGLFKVSGY
jgi:hypothetical protein